MRRYTTPTVTANITGIDLTGMHTFTTLRQGSTDALQLLFDNVNKGQQKQIVKREEIKKLFDRYGVEY